jgi:hypothetical protein
MTKKERGPYDLFVGVLALVVVGLVGWYVFDQIYIPTNATTFHVDEDTVWRCGPASNLTGTRVCREFFIMPGTSRVLIGRCLGDPNGGTCPPGFNPNGTKEGGGP